MTNFGLVDILVSYMGHFHASDAVCDRAGLEVRERHQTADTLVKKSHTTFECGLYRFTPSSMPGDYNDQIRLRKHQTSPHDFMTVRREIAESPGGRTEARGRKADLKQSVDRPSGESARQHAAKWHVGLSQRRVHNRSRSAHE